VGGHFTLDGTLVEAWASRKSFKPRQQRPAQPPDDPGKPTGNFHGERRSNATHQSTTDFEAKLVKKDASKEAKLCYSANALMEKRNGLLLEFTVEPAYGYAKRKSARAMLETELPSNRRITLGADSGYAVSQRVRTRFEEIFGWTKPVGGLRKILYRGLDHTQLHAHLTAAYDRSESPDSGAPPHEGRPHRTGVPASAGQDRQAQRLSRPSSPSSRSNWEIKPFLNIFVCWRSGTRIRVGGAAGRYILGRKISSSSGGRRATASA
jgi:hypothetical protein